MNTPLDPRYDDISSYETVDRLHLKRKPNGDCVYLGDMGCTIYDRRPRICRTFDCREAFRQSNRLGRRRSSSALKRVFKRGEELLQEQTHA